MSVLEKSPNNEFWVDPRRNSFRTTYISRRCRLGRRQRNTENDSLLINNFYFEGTIGIIYLLVSVSFRIVERLLEGFALVYAGYVRDFQVTDYLLGAVTSCQRHHLVIDVKSAAGTHSLTHSPRYVRFGHYIISNCI